MTSWYYSNVSVANSRDRGAVDRGTETTEGVVMNK